MARSSAAQVQNAGAEERMRMDNVRIEMRLRQTRENFKFHSACIIRARNESISYAATGFLLVDAED